ncbi:phosphoserine phosphatase SerB [Scandinavium manionii]|uniref:phosphoserine phosphatase SerB n=1 Tax=Scandinavium manionii TaxID=2926520 RepID=UPI0035AF6823
MKTLYFITHNTSEPITSWLHQHLMNNPSGNTLYMLTKHHSPMINRDYLKLVISGDVVGGHFYQPLRRAALEMQFDFFYKPAVIPANGLIVFDMDSTFIEEEGVDEIARTLGISEKITALTQQAMEGKLDFDTSFTRRIAMLSGTHNAVLDDVCNRMTLSPGLDIILPILKAKGFKTAIISGGLDLFAQRLKKRYQLDFAFSNTVEMKNGVLTGNITHPIINAENKKQTLINLAADLNISLSNVIACGDGANDLPMLLQAGTGLAWKAKPLVKEHIHQQINFNGFESLLFFLEDGL